MTLNRQPITREQFVKMPRKGLDHFAATFAAKADAMKLWPLVKGLVDEESGTVLAAICIRISQRVPCVANLQLLHTFATQRRQGFASILVKSEYQKASFDAAYFRVSSEPDAADFYRSLGLKFWGRQKSGSLLCMHKIGGPKPNSGIYVIDAAISKALFTKARGGLVETFPEPI